MRIETDSGQFVSETAASCGWSKETGTYALASVVNSLAAGDVSCRCAEAKIIFPAHADNSKAYGMERNIRRICKERGIELQEMKIIQNSLSEVPSVMICGAGYGQYEADGVKALTQAEDRQIVLVKWTGMEGMLRIMDEKEEELRQRFASVFLRKIQSYRKDIFAGKELEIAKRTGALAVRQITEGGIFAALWNLAKETKAGLELDLKRMSILQETVEVCEYFRVNPYQLTSAGSFLMLTEDGKSLCDAMHENQIEAAVIGKLTKGNDKVIHNGEDLRYLDRPAPDEIYKIMM